jgi:hypothetical protein
MDMEYWQKQTADKPLFENILWSRPEHKNGAGKLLIVGGNTMSFAAVGEAYNIATKSGSGVVRTLLPDKLRSTVGPLMDQCDFAPSTHSGSFAKDALNELLIQAHWADMVLLAGDFGRNSETAILLEQFVSKYSGPLTLTKDAVDYFTSTPKYLLDREKTAIILSLAQMQKIGIGVKTQSPFLLSMGLMLLVQALHEFSELYKASIVTKELNYIVVAQDGKVSSTKLTDEIDLWRVKTAAAASVLWMQNPTKAFEAITTSLII